MYKNCLTLLLTLLVPVLGWADSVKAAAPSASAAYYIHLDKPFYVNGEVIWYQLSLPADRQHQSAVIKMVISDKNGKTLHYNFLKNRNAFYVDGYYKIPFDLPSGRYRISFLATDATTAQRYRLAFADLSIYNDSEKLPANVVMEAQRSTAVATDGLTDLRVDIRLSADTVQSRQEIRTTINVTDGNGRAVAAQMSLAVTDQELAGEESLFGLTVIPGLAVPVSQQLDTSITFRARLTDYNGEPLVANVLGVLMPQQNRIEYTRTMAPGLVNLRLRDFYGRQPLQFLGFPDEEDSIRVEILADEQLAAEGELTYTTEVLEYLRLSQQRKKIFQLYTDLEFNLQPTAPPVAAQTLDPERTVNVKDYEPFDNVYLFFKEILTPLVFRQVSGEIFEAKVFTDRGNRVYEMLPGAPLFIVDGQATRDGNYIAHMKTDMIETVSIFTDRSELRQQFNVMGRSGVVIIKTSSADITVPESDADDIKLVTGLQPPVAFPAFDPAQFQGDRHRPFFRPQLHWQSGLRTGTDGRANASFFQSDARGDFQVRVLVRDDQGRVGYAEKTYRAVW